MNDAKEKLKTYAEKGIYSHKQMEKSNIGELRSEIAGIFDRIYKDTQDERIKLNLLMGEISFWLFMAHKSTGHDYDCILKQVIKVIPSIEKSFEDPLHIKKRLDDMKKKVDKL